MGRYCPHMGSYCLVDGSSKYWRQASVSLAMVRCLWPHEIYSSKGRVLLAPLTSLLSLCKEFFWLLMWQCGVYVVSGAEYKADWIAGECICATGSQVKDSIPAGWKTWLTGSRHMNHNLQKVSSGINILSVVQAKDSKLSWRRLNTNGINRRTSWTKTGEGDQKDQGVSARKTELQCVSSGVTSFLH